MKPYSFDQIIFGFHSNWSANPGHALSCWPHRQSGFRDCLGAEPRGHPLALQRTRLRWRMGRARAAVASRAADRSAVPLRQPRRFPGGHALYGRLPWVGLKEGAYGGDTDPVCLAESQEITVAGDDEVGPACDRARDHFDIRVIADWNLDLLDGCDQF